MVSEKSNTLKLCGSRFSPAYLVSLYTYPSLCLRRCKHTATCIRGVLYAPRIVFAVGEEKERRERKRETRYRLKSRTERSMLLTGRLLYVHRNSSAILPSYPLRNSFFHSSTAAIRHPISRFAITLPLYLSPWSFHFPSSPLGL